MSLEQVVFALAGAVCVAGAVLAVTHRDARASGAALMATLLALAVLYAGLAAPAVAALVILVALFATAPLVDQVVQHRVHGRVAQAELLLVGLSRPEIGARCLVDDPTRQADRARELEDLRLVQVADRIEGERVVAEMRGVAEERPLSCCPSR